MLTRNSQKILIAFSSLVIVLASLLPVHAVSSWSGDRPTTNFTYRSGTGGPVNISNSQSGQDRVQSALAVEVSQFSQDVGPSQPPNDQYVLRVLGAANSRIPHNYVLNGYGDDFTDCTA